MERLARNLRSHLRVGGMIERPMNAEHSEREKLVERLTAAMDFAMERQLAWQRSCGIFEDASLLPPSDPRAQAHRAATTDLHNALPSLWSLISEAASALLRVGEELEEARKLLDRERPRADFAVAARQTAEARVAKAEKALEEANGVVAHLAQPVPQERLVTEAWQWLLDKDDRTSPEEY